MFDMRFKKTTKWRRRENTKKIKKHGVRDNTREKFPNKKKKKTHQLLEIKLGIISSSFLLLFQLINESELILILLFS